MAVSAQDCSSCSLPSLLLLFISSTLFAVGFYAAPTHALDIGIHANAGLNLLKQCSRTCESSFCEAPPFLRYGKYCGLLYSGCPGEQPCDRLDACCMHHDQCIAKMGNDYLSQECNKAFLHCVEVFKKSGEISFKGNTCDVDQVVSAINHAMRAAILAGRVLGKP
ncbi:phospholipase A2-alpha [Andrographis paniculata]|uniref:phospholipase A2-alpha n=1 Tax=Andrographis paniculata TaxID=175694 RepID=UPI0021E7A817|nr:phospholipase A2-alpha [Andrographis paniculata]